MEGTLVHLVESRMRPGLYGGMTMLGLGCREEAGTRDCQSNDVRRIMQSYVVRKLVNVQVT